MADYFGEAQTQPGSIFQISRFALPLLPNFPHDRFFVVNKRMPSAANNTKKLRFTDTET